MAQPYVSSASKDCQQSMFFLRIVEHAKDRYGAASDEAASLRTAINEGASLFIPRLYPRSLRLAA